MASPSPSPKPSPPRKPLHERSQSHANERISPTVRIIGDPNAQIYSSNPFPTLPAHVLSPKRGSRQGVVFEDGKGILPGSSWTDELRYELEATPLSSASNGKAKQGPTAPDGTYRSEFQSVPARPTSMSQPISAATTTATIADAQDPPSDQVASVRFSDEIIQLPSVPQKGEALRSHRLTNDFSTIPQPMQMAPKVSDNSLSSAESTGTVIRTKPRARTLRHGSYSAFPNYPRPSSSKSSLYSSRPNSNKSNEDVSQGSSGYSAPPILSASSTPNTSRVPSNPARASLQPVDNNGEALQYPIIRPPTASGSWAESSSSTLTRPTRTLKRDSGRWNPHLSVVHSEATEGRNSGTVWYSESGHGSIIEASPQNSLSGKQPVLRSVRTRSRDLTGSTVRIVREQEDNITALPTLGPSLGNSGSYHHSRKDSLQVRPSSKGSFLQNSIPAWARIYYARPQSAASDASFGIFRSRSRPRLQTANYHRRNSMGINPLESGSVVAEVHGTPRRKLSQVWSPHLWRDRRSIGGRRSIFKAPSLDEEAAGEGKRRREMQIWLFAIGFLIPFGWFIASFLPLPPKPNVKYKEPIRRLSHIDLARNLEEAVQQIDEARYENVKWWRNLNRLMSLIGVIIIATIITLAIVAVHMKR